MLYIELYLYDFLKGKKAEREAETELWGRKQGGGIFTSAVSGKKGERKSFYRGHMQYLGNYREISGDRRQPVLVYERQGEIFRREITPYISKETEQIEHFLIKEGQRGQKAENRLKKVEKITEERKEEPVKTDGKQKGNPAGMVICAVLIFLSVNMIEALSSYQKMQEIIEIVELLVK